MFLLVTSLVWLTVGYGFVANRKKAEARKTGGGPPPPPFTQAEELALSQNSGRPITDGIPGGSSTEPRT